MLQSSERIETEENTKQKEATQITERRVRTKIFAVINVGRFLASNHRRYLSRLSELNPFFKLVVYFVLCFIVIIVEQDACTMPVHHVFE